MKRLSFLFIAVMAFASAAGSAASADESEDPTPSSIYAVSTTFNGEQEITTYSDGSKVLDPASFNECPDGWVCLWKDINYEGRMLQFQTRGEWQSLVNPWNFNDETSSWRNRTNDDAKLSWNAGGGEPHLCMQPNSSASAMGGWNDQATEIKIFKTSTVC